MSLSLKDWEGLVDLVKSAQYNSQKTTEFSSKFMSKVEIDEIYSRFSDRELAVCVLKNIARIKGDKTFELKNDVKKYVHLYETDFMFL